jgi:hypothetical protein
VSSTFPYKVVLNSMIKRMAAQQESKDPAVPIGKWLPAVILAWFIPGGGHLLLKRRGRAALLMASVTLMFLFGIFMRGSMFVPQNGDLLTILINCGGFLGDLSSGALYMMASLLGYDQPAMSTITAPSFWFRPDCSTCWRWWTPMRSPWERRADAKGKLVAF